LPVGYVCSAAKFKRKIGKIVAEQFPEPKSAEVPFGSRLGWILIGGGGGLTPTQVEAPPAGRGQVGFAEFARPTQSLPFPFCNSKH
jgi:hypothetical protein